MPVPHMPSARLAMTPKPKTVPTDAGAIIRFPDHPNFDDMSAFNYVLLPALPQALIHHFGNRETTIITSELAARLTPTENLEGVLYPDLLIAFDVDPAAHFARNGYAISEQGKPPDFVMEVASKWTHRRDEIERNRKDNYLHRDGHPRILAVRPHRAILPERSSGRGYLGERPVQTHPHQSIRRRESLGPQSSPGLGSVVGKRTTSLLGPG